MTDEASAFLAEHPIEPDRFQIESARAIDRGEAVVVTAPTGAGKTLIAEAAIARAMKLGRRSFYTAPIKALSNQKFGDLVAAYGGDHVGLLTGDNTINAEAPMVVMTTEVLRNMIYADSAALDDLGVVILDEVHYLQDRYRGSVWEEVIIHLPQTVQLISLSATIANPTEFTGWVESRRGTTSLIVEHHRPVPLESTYLLSDRFHNHALERFPVFDSDGKRGNKRLLTMLRKGRGKRPRFSTPRRLEVSEHLLGSGLLPAIYFIFSRAGCDAASRMVAGAGLGLTTAADREQIRAVVVDRTAHLAQEDLAVLGFAAWLDTLEAGVAAHHAGMIPAFKETVEQLFAAGLVKVVFATETLALGINMPAKAVVLEEFSKFTGEGHETLRAGDYTQLTGRAGRRGIDERGTAVVLYSRYVPFSTVVDVAGAGSHPLVSSFDPSYNMAVNLVANYERSQAEEMLEASFAQYRSQEGRRALERRIEERTTEMTEFRAAATCERGDIASYLAQGDGEHRAESMRIFARSLHEGDVLTITGRDRWVLLARGWGNAPRVLLLSDAARTRRLRPTDFGDTTAHLGTMRLAEPVTTRDPAYLRAVADSLRSWQSTEPSRSALGGAPGDDAIAACPDIEAHRSFFLRAERAEKDLRRLRRRLQRRGNDLLKRFSRRISVLESLGYLQGWSLTQRGQRLRRVYNEMDLLIVEAVERGLLDQLSSAELAGVVSAFTFQPRKDDLREGRMVGRVSDQLLAIDELWRELVVAENGAGLDPTRQPEPGFAGIAHAWALGASLDELFGEDDFGAGDFVRNGRQLLDLLRQLRDGFPAIAVVAAEAVRAIDRGVVASGGRL
ncbi:MAG: DEAD/DEAH box helicase [Acidimicrobiia bacterium]|nr:MAG: DEAD/DEAH box helicase [Acidimicrobiia bacterium]